MNSLILHHLGHGDIQVRPAIKQCQGNTVEFSDGSRADYDKILFATGYKLHYPFIDASTLNWQGPAPNLYLNVFNPSEPNVLMLGMIEAAGLGWQGRAEQAELAALYLRAQQDKPSAVNEFRRTIAEAMAKDAHKMDGGMAYLKLDRMAYYVHKETYRATIKQHTRQLKQQLKA